MVFVQPINVLRIQEELKKYQDLCNQYNHTPIKKEFEDIVNFILLHSGTSGDIFECNSSTIDFLYEDFIQKINEAHAEAGGEAQWDNAVDAATNVAKGVMKGLAVGAALTAVYIAFLFKRGKLKAALDNEKKIEMDKLNAFKKIIDLSIQVSKIKGEPPPKLTSLTQPSTTEEPGMPEKPDSPGSSDQN